MSFLQTTPSLVFMRSIYTVPFCRSDTLVRRPSIEKYSVDILLALVVSLISDVLAIGAMLVLRTSMSVAFAPFTGRFKKAITFMSAGFQFSGKVYV